MKPTKLLYGNGLPFNGALDRCLDEQIERVKNNFASIIIIDGGQGQGKTTLLDHCVNYVNNKVGIGKCSLGIKDHPQISLGGKEFIKHFNICKDKGLPICGYDEAGDFSRRGSVSRFNAMLNRRFETYRSSKIIVIICLPNFNVLDNNLFDLKIVRALIHLDNREKTLTYGNYTVFSLYAMNWIRYWHDKLPKAVRHECYKKTSWNFKGQFKDLDPKRKKLLANLSDYGKDKQSVLAEIKLEGLLSYGEIAHKVARSIIWVRKAVAELKIKPVRRVLHTLYFHGATVDRLLDKIENRS